MNRPVKNAWIVLNGGHNMLYVQFEEPYDTTGTDWYPANVPDISVMPVARFEERDGIIEYGMFVANSDGKSFWFGKPALSTFNAMAGTSFTYIVEVIASERHKAFPALRSRAVPKEFANEILEKFGLPFELVFDLGAGDGTTVAPAYVQKAETIKIGQTAMHTKEGECMIQKCIFDHETGNAHITAYPINDPGHPIRGTFEDFPDVYKGVTYQQFMDMWHNTLYHGA